METRHGIKYRQLHIEDYLREIPAEQGKVTGEYAHEWITGNPDTSTDFWTDNLLDTILRSDNLNAAYRRVKANRGSGGTDGMQVDELLPYPRDHGDELVRQLREGKYRPNPVRRVEIPKEEKGKVRKLGIPTVVDRMVQQAMAQELTAFQATPEGVPQGGPLSPLCGNVMLNELDKELERRGHKFVRYADDCLILCKSRKSAERTLKHIVPYITGKLYLKVNLEKTTVSHISKVKYLGHSFYRSKGKCRMRVHPKSVRKMKNRLRELTARGNKWSNPEREEKLRNYTTGWINYYRYADMKSLMENTDKWLCHRIRAVYWKQWKRVRTRYKIFRTLRLPEWQVHKLANCRKGIWRAAEMLNSVLTKTIIVDRLGYPSMTAHYLKVRVNY